MRVGVEGVCECALGGEEGRGDIHGRQEYVC